MKSFINKNLLLLLGLGLVFIIMGLRIRSILTNGTSTSESAEIAQDQRQIKNLIMIMNLPGFGEKSQFDAPSIPQTEEHHEAMDATLFDFAMAFDQAAAPIIVSANTLVAFLHYALLEEKLELAQKDIAILHPDTPQPPDVTEQSLGEIEEHLTMFKDDAVLLSVSYLLNKDKWFYLSDPESKIFLLIPKTYLNISCGFDPNFVKPISENLTDIDQAKALHNHLSDIVEKQRYNPISENESEALSIIKKMFISNTQEPNNWWDIYLVGSGAPAHMGGNDFAAVSTKARIAGFSFDNFKKFITFLNGGSKTKPGESKIESGGVNTLFLFYMSCFAGGYNQELVRQTLNDLNANFFAVAHGTGDQPVGLQYYPELFLTPSHHIIFNYVYKFASFFETVKMFFTDTTIFTDKTKRAAQISKDPLLTLIRSMVGYETIEGNTQPFIYIPKVGVFGALNVDDRIQILTSAQAKAYEFENKEIDAQTKLCLMVYPSRISVNVKLSDNTRLVSLQPPQWEKLVIDGKEQLVVPANYKSIHYFESVTVNGIFQNFLYSLLELKSPYMEVWLFKKLICNDLTSGTQTNFNFMVFGKLPGTIYILKENASRASEEPDLASTSATPTSVPPVTDMATISSESTTFQHKRDKLKEDVTNLSFSKLKKPEDFDHIIENLGLKSEGLIHATSLTQIFDMLAQKTRKPTDVQEIGALKRVLEEHQIKKEPPTKRRARQHHTK